MRKAEDEMFGGSELIYVVRARKLVVSKSIKVEDVKTSNGRFVTR
jgi:hypothetical protein